MKFLTPALFVLLLAFSGCAAVDDYKTLAATKAATAADALLTDAEWATCSAASVGSVKRKYGQTLKRAKAYKDFCDGDGTANVIAPQ